MRVVITGATGYIGQKLVRRLKEEGHYVCAVVRGSSDTGTICNYTDRILCSEPYEELENLMVEVKPEIYINLAGYYCGTHTTDKIHALIEGNITLPTYVMHAAVNAGCRHVIHTASVQQCAGGEVYAPMNLYAATKQAFEDILYYYTSVQKIKAITLQLFDTYGADDKRRKVFNLVRMLKSGERIAMSPGKQKLFFCYIEDVIDAYICAVRLIKEAAPGNNVRYAVRAEEPIELRRFIEEYLRLTGKRIEIEWGGREYMEREIMDPTGIGDTLPDWKPEISYMEGLGLCSEYDLSSCTD